MPNRTIIRCVSAVHEFWYRLTGGLVGGRVGRAPVLLLTTRGRKSGRQRTTPLLYVQDGRDLVIIASNGRSDQHPDWWVNLRSDPRAEVQLGRERLTMRAEKASAEEKGRLWPQITRMYPQYAGYQRRTKRDIPVVILRPGGE